MAAIEKLEKLMQRLGFVRLERYGLLLTGDDRVVSLRPAVLDDGLGARVVGWRDNDLASAELTSWQPGGAPSLVAPQPVRRLPAPPPPPRAALMISPVAAPNPLAEYVAPAAPAPAAPAAAFAAAFAPEPTSFAAARFAPAPVAVPPPLAAPEPEEDWEAILAAARARAAAPEPAIAAAPAPAAAEPAESARPTEITAAQQPADARSTVIPIPTLPRIVQASATSLYRPEPVVRAPAAMPAQPRRFARGTRPVDHDVVGPTDERTETQLQVAPAARPIPSIKQRTAGQ